MIIHEAGADAHLATRIDKMHSRDRAGLIIFITVLLSLINRSMRKIV